MGAKLAKAAAVRGKHLAAREYKALMWMALNTIDDHRPHLDAGHWFGGWEPISIAIGRDVPDEDLDDPEVTSRRTELRREASKVLRQLASAGFIRPRVAKPRTGRQQEYDVLPSPRPVDNADRGDAGAARLGGQSDPPAGGRSVPPGGRTEGTDRPRLGGQSVPPKEQPRNNTSEELPEDQPPASQPRPGPREGQPVETAGVSAAAGGDMAQLPVTTGPGRARLHLQLVRSNNADAAHVKGQ